MTKRMFLAICLTLAVSTSSFADFYKNDYDSAVKDSLKTGKTLVVLVSASWCGPCNQLKKEIAKSYELGQLPKDVNIAIVDYDSKVGKKISVSGSIPQLIRYEKRDGKWYKNFSIGYLSQSKFKDFCNGKK
jgi:thioredoxin-related protein